MITRWEAAGSFSPASHTPAGCTTKTPENHPKALGENREEHWAWPNLPLRIPERLTNQLGHAGLVVFSCLRREKKPVLPSTGVGGGGKRRSRCRPPRPLARRAIFALTSEDCFGGEAGRKAGCLCCADSRGVNHTGDRRGSRWPHPRRRQRLTDAVSWVLQSPAMPQKGNSSFSPPLLPSGIFYRKEDFSALKENVGCSVPQLTPEPTVCVWYPGPSLHPAVLSILHPNPPPAP